MFSPDGKTLATADCDGTARLWDVATPVTSVTFLPGRIAMAMILASSTPVAGLVAVLLAALLA